MADDTRPPHIMVIVSDEMGVLEYSIECPGITEDCRAWTRCGQEPCAKLVEGDESLESFRLHGTDHLVLGETEPAAFVATDSCLLVTWPRLAYAGEGLGLVYPGRFPVDSERECDCCLGLVLRESR